MSKGLEDLFGTLRKAAAVQLLGSLSDRALLERFLTGGEEAAFTVLIERHGPMVFEVCRRSLANRHDAEDACQATFLILARKVASLRKKESLSCWLHGIASRVAANLKRHASRRRRHELQISSMLPADPAREISGRENKAVLDEELRRLPEEYRAPLILCYLEQVPRDRAASALGLSEGSLHGRLERGRGLLRQRLTRRGVSLSLLTSAGVAGSTSAGTLPATFVVASARAAALVAAGQPVSTLIGSNVLLLTREVIKGMLLTKLQWGSMAVIGTAVLALVGGTFASRGEAQDGPKGPGSVPVGALNQADSSDEMYIRKLSQNMRGSEPTPAEIYLFVTLKDAQKRDKLIELFGKEMKSREAQLREQTEQKRKEVDAIAEQLQQTLINKDREQAKQAENHAEKAKLQAEEAKARLRAVEIELQKQRLDARLQEARAIQNRPEASLVKVAQGVLELWQALDLSNKKEQKEKIDQANAKVVASLGEVIAKRMTQQLSSQDFANKLTEVVQGIKQSGLIDKRQLKVEEIAQELEKVLNSLKLLTLGKDQRDPRAAEKSTEDAEKVRLLEKLKREELRLREEIEKEKAKSWETEEKVKNDILNQLADQLSGWPKEEAVQKLQRAKDKIQTKIEELTASGNATKQVVAVQLRKALQEIEQQLQALKQKEETKKGSTDVDATQQQQALEQRLVELKQMRDKVDAERQARLAVLQENKQLQEMQRTMAEQLERLRREQARLRENQLVEMEALRQKQQQEMERLQELERRLNGAEKKPVPPPVPGRSGVIPSGNNFRIDPTSGTPGGGPPSRQNGVKTEMPPTVPGIVIPTKNPKTELERLQKELQKALKSAKSQDEIDRITSDYARHIQELLSQLLAAPKKDPGSSGSTPSEKK